MLLLQSPHLKFWVGGVHPVRPLAVEAHCKNMMLAIIVVIVFFLKAISGITIDLHNFSYD